MTRWRSSRSIREVSNYFKRFAWKLSNSRSVSLMFDHFFFVFVEILVFQLPIKYHYNHWFFFVISSATRLIYPFFGILCCCIRWRICFHTFFATSKERFSVVFRIWRNKDSFCRTPSFSVRMIRFYLDTNTRRLTDSS